MAKSPDSPKKKYRFDIKFYDLGKYLPFTKKFPIHDILNKKTDRPTGYAYFYFEGTSQEFNELHESLIQDEKWVKIIGIDDLSEMPNPEQG